MMIRFWGREVVGWLLILIGLGIFYLCIALLLSPGPEFILEGPGLIFIGFIVFRGGIHLLKVAIAARVCMQTQTDLAKAPATEKRTKRTATPWDW